MAFWLLRACLVLLAVLLTSARPARAAGVEIILDVSGSMAAKLGTELKIDAAKRAIAATVESLPEGSVLALRLYGHRVPRERKDESCRDSELVIPFQPVEKTRFMDALEGLLPRGQTPIAYSLEEAARDFAPAGDEERVVILVTDGEETCGGDPVAVARDLLSRGFTFKIHTIGFDVDEAARAQLEAISEATGGRYLDAKDASTLGKHLRVVAGSAAAPGNEPVTVEGPNGIRLIIRGYGKDLSDGSDVKWNSGFPSLSYDDDPERGGLPNAVWEGAVTWEGEAVCLHIRALHAPYPPLHRLAVGYEVSLEGAHFEDGSARKTLVLTEYSGDPEDTEVKQCYRVPELGP